MNYYDMDYHIFIENNSELLENDEIVDILIKRTDHFCESTEVYWDNIQDEALYLKVKTNEGVDKIVCVAKNFVKENEIHFDTPVEKEDFYQVKHNEELYNQLEIYLTLSDKQAVQLLNIMSSNIDSYDYRFQYCNQDKIVKNIVKPNLDNENVQQAYGTYLELSYQKNALNEMLSHANENSIFKFSSEKNKK